MPNIVEWREIRENFNHTVLLGNGASMAVHPDFGYGSLYDAANQLGFLDGPVRTVFEQFNTFDFELVLRRLWYTSLVNEAFGNQPGAVEQAYQQVRTALIQTVRETHVTYADAEDHLPNIYRFLKRFDSVISLNYDLIVYWSIMFGNRTLGRWFKDGFMPATFRDDWESLREPFGAERATLVFYPHGNLILTRTPEGSEVKLAGGDERLLDVILQRWEGRGAIPLFVCEGTAEHKKSAIESSSYLQRVYREVMPSLEESLVIYGWNLSIQDQHILSQLQRSNVSRVAVSVRNNDAAYIQRVEETLSGIGIREIYFFDSASEGCWIN
ncbi:DUF4917 family protein [Pseudomonas sp. MDT1-17]